MNVYPIIKLLHGVKTYIPGLNKRPKGGGATNSARYCYSVWMRHLVMAYKNGLRRVPKVVAELGPGYSIGVGISAILSGAEQYYAFDAESYTDRHTDLKVFNEIVELFKTRASIPGPDEFPNLKPYLDSYEFPGYVFDNDKLQERVKTGSEEIFKRISYFAPYNDARILKKQTVDMLIAQAVMQEVEPLAPAYKVLSGWIKPGGIISCTVDFKSYKTAEKWNGHWAYSDLTWKLIKGKRGYLINRQPYSAHVNYIKESGFEIVRADKITDNSGIKRQDLAKRFKHISDEDLLTSGVFIQAIKTDQRPKTKDQRLKTGLRQGFGEAGQDFL